MNLRLSKNTIFRNFQKNYGYLINFDSSKEMLVDESGIVFIEILTKKMQTFNAILVLLKTKFSILSADDTEFEKDAFDFYYNLFSQGFIDCEFITRQEKDNQSIVKSIQDNNENIQTINNFKDLESVLYIGTLILTENCINKCIHCYSPSYCRDIQFMDEGIFKDALEQFKKAGVVKFDISGGEPLMHPKFVDFMDCVKNYDVRLRLITNGQLITRKLAKYFSDFSFSQVQITLYALDEKIHDSITQVKGSCLKTKNGIKYLIDEGVPVSISCPIMKNNKDEYEELYKWQKEIGAIGITPNPFLSYTVDHLHTNKDVVLNKHEVEQFSKVLLKLAKQENFTPYNTVDKKQMYDKVFQNTFYSSLTVMPNGNIVCGTLMTDIILGNIKKDNIADIFSNSEILQEYRNIKISDIDGCSECAILDFCGINLGDHWVANKDVLKPDLRLCEMYRAHFKKIIN